MEPTDPARRPGRTVEIARPAFNAMMQHAITAWPHEICGLIGGDGGRLQRVVPVENVATPLPGRCGFHMDPTGQLQAFRSFEDAGLELTGIYHSHPKSTPVPSDQDLEFAAFPDTAYLIIGFEDPEAPVVEAWRIDELASVPLELVVGAGSPDAAGELRPLRGVRTQHKGT